MGDVVDLKPGEPELAYWVCACGCMSHHVRNDGEVECGACGELAHGPGFFLSMPDGMVREPVAGEPEPFTSTVVDGAFLVKRFAERVRAGEFLAVVGFCRDGKTSTISDHEDFETNEQRQWLRRQMRAAYKLLVS